MMVYSFEHGERVASLDDKKRSDGLVNKFLSLRRLIIILLIFTTSLLVLPLVLPPLPPPPSTVLFVPLVMLGVLVLLAMSPSTQIPNEITTSFEYSVS